MNSDLFLERQKQENKGSHEGMKMQERIAPEILKTIPATLNVVDTDYNILAIGGNISRISKGTEKIIGKKCHKVFQKRDKPCPWCKIGHVIMTGEVLNEMTAPDDPREKLVGKPLNVYVCPLKGKDGDIIGVLELATDITRIRKAEEERKKAEEALRESEEKYHSLYDTMKEGVAIHEVVYDTSGQAKDYMILDVNPSFEEILGLKKEKAVGCEASRLYGTGQPPDIEIYARVAASGQATSFETYFPPMDKHFSISAFSPRRGQFAAVFTDITDRKRVEESLQRAHEKLELRVEERTAELARTNELLRKQIAKCKRAEGKVQESERMARALLNTPTDIAGVLDRKGIVLDANQTMCRRFRKSVDDLIGVCIWDLLPPNLAKGRKSYADKVFQTGKPVRIEDEREGHWFDNVVHPVFDANGKVSKVALLARDITEMKWKEKELAEKEAELRTKAKNLEEVNIALRVLLKQREGDKAQLEEKVLSNVKDLIMPYLERLKKTSLDNNQMSSVDILQSNLKEIISPFSRKLSSKYLGLTPTEIRVANLIKKDKTTKEIAEIMNVSEKTVNTHRDHIRKKIGIKRKKVNLRTYLSSLQQ